jgi:hypothetical protein
MGTSLNQALVFPPAVGRIAFIAKGDFFSGGGVSAADKACNTEAAAVTPPLPGTYAAVVGSTTESIKTHITKAATSSLPWVRTDGVQIVANADDFFDPTKPLLAALNVHNVPYQYHLATREVMVGAATMTMPASPTDNCNDWTDTSTAADMMVGHPNATDGLRFDTGYMNQCNYNIVIYCLQQ